MALARSRAAFTGRSALPLPHPSPVAWPAPPAAHSMPPVPARGEAPPRSFTRHGADDAALIVCPPAPGPPLKAARRGPEATASVRTRAAALGLLGPLEEAGSAPPVGADPGNAYVQQLERHLLSQAADAWDTPRLATALTWLEHFVEATGRTLFMPARDRHSRGCIWNRRTIDLFIQHIVTSAPLRRTRGEHVSIDVARTYASAVYLLRCREACYDIAPAEDNFIAPLAAKTTRRSQPLAQQERALGAGIRAVHFAAAAASGFDRTSPRGVRRWAVAIASHNLFLRGGEPGVPDNARHEPRRILRGRSFQWQRPVRCSKGRLWLLVWVIPIKDPEGKHTGFPCPVARRHDGAFLSDPLCPYDALAMAWWQRMHPASAFPLDAYGQPLQNWWLASVDPTMLAAPMFLGDGGEVWRTSDSLAIFKEIAQAAGVDPAPVGAKAGRIGGATDARERLGAAGERAIIRRGRWCSLVGLIYQRELVSTQLAMSADLGDALSESLEELGLGWVQPASG